MATMTITQRLTPGWGHHLWYFICKLVYGESPVNESACNEAAQMERAIRIVQLASNPGECYEAVAARIEWEAARYRAFRKEPHRVCNFELIVKNLDSQSSPQKVQWHISDPAEGQQDPREGRFSGSHRLKRSSNLVLEFFILGDNNERLFPIARTYSNWIGAKEFDLGSGQKFYLDMIEDAPGYVMVHAGFVPYAEKSLSREPVQRRSSISPQAASAKATRKPRFGVFNFAELLMNLGNAQGMLAFFVCCSLTWAAIAGAAIVLVPTYAQPAESALPSDNNHPHEWLIASSQPTFASFAFSPEAKAPALRKIASSFTTKPRFRNSPDVKITIDDSFCRDSEKGCSELVANVQQAVQAHFPIDSIWRDLHGDGLRLVISYALSDWQRGQVFLTVYDRKGQLMNTSHLFDCGGKDVSIFVKAFCSESSWQLLSIALESGGATDGACPEIPEKTAGRTAAE